MAVNTYTGESYKNKLLIVEKITIEKALKRAKGKIKEAHKLLCPNGYPYTYNALIRVLKKHKIESKNYKV